MLKMDQNRFEASDGSPIYYYTTPRRPGIKAVVIVVHGMAEHARRYREFAEYLYRQDILTYVIDQRGHGLTGTYTGTMGHLDDTDGWKCVVEDVRILTKIARDENPGLPLFILGHSMGSVVVRSCLIDFGNLYQGAVIVGTTLGIGGTARRFGQLIARAEIAKCGAGHPSPLLKKISFGGYNKHFHTNRTEYDWLSENPENVDAYIDDPLCGFTCTAGFFRDLFSGISYASNPHNIARIPQDLPLLLLAGESDPVGGMGKEVRALYKRMQDARLNTRLILYPQMRHEILNEVSRKEVYEDILAFLKPFYT